MKPRHAVVLAAALPALSMFVPFARASISLLTEEVSLVFSGYVNAFLGFIETGRVHMLELDAKDERRTFSLDMDEQGRTSPISVAVGSRWDIHVEETPQSFGIALGQTFRSWTVEGPNSEEEVLGNRFDFQVFQAVLRSASLRFIGPQRWRGIRRRRLRRDLGLVPGHSGAW